MRLTFITGNKNKAKEATRILEGHDIDILDLDLHEVQSLDPKIIIAQKLKEARKSAGNDAAILVEDVSFWIGDTGLPGPLIKFFNSTIGTEGIVTFAEAFKAKSARAECHIGLLRPDIEEPEFFIGTVEGNIVTPRGTNGFGFDPVFQPNDHDKTYAEMTADEKNNVSHRARAFAAMRAKL